MKLCDYACWNTRDEEVGSEVGRRAGDECDGMKEIFERMGERVDRRNVCARDADLLVVLSS